MKSDAKHSDYKTISLHIFPDISENEIIFKY